MDAQRRKLEENRKRLLKELADVNTQLERLDGLFESVPHYQEIEETAHRAAVELSQLIQQQASREVAAEQASTCGCPWCEREVEIEFVKRFVQSADGPVEITEPRGECTACRRSFFPST